MPHEQGEDILKEISPMDIRILLIIKNEYDKELLEKPLVKIKENIEVITFFSLQDAQLQLKSLSPGLVIIDSSFGNKAIIAFRNLIVQKYRDIPFIILLHDEKSHAFFLTHNIQIIYEDNNFLSALPALTEEIYQIYSKEKEQGIMLQKISNSQKALQGLIDAIPDPIFVRNEDHEIIRMNKAFANLYDKHPKEIIGDKCYELICCHFKPNRCPSDKVLATGDIVSFEQARYGKNYYITISPFTDEDSKIVAAVYVMKDITEMKRLRESLYKSEKLASIGKLVSGVAHEINNPLTGVMGYTQLLSTLINDSKHLNYINQIIKSAEKCKEIIDNLLTFCRQKEPVKTLGYVNEAIQKTLELRAYELRKKKINVVKDLQQVQILKFDFQQIQQVILNIIINAEDAITSKGIEEGEVRIKTEADDEWVYLHFSNNGPPITPENMRKIFDPFYTTKEINKGPGLGLSVAYGIIQDHGGDITVSNLSEKEGVCFTVKLPFKDLS